MYAPRYLDGKRVQLMDIYYNGVGILRELSPEEMEEAFQEHLAERERSKAKTAQSKATLFQQNYYLT